MNKRMNMRRRALTLVEMVFVGSCGAVLLASVAPGLNRVREDASQTKCMANLGGIGRANQMYSADDVDNQVIPVGHAYSHTLRGAYIWGGKMGTGGNDTGTLLESSYGVARDAGPGQRPLNRYLYKESGCVTFQEFEETWDDSLLERELEIEMPIYQCPSDTGHTSTWEDSGSGSNQYNSTVYFAASGESAYDFYGNSYVADLFWVLIASGGKPVPMEGDTIARSCSMSAFLNSADRLRSPQTTLIYREANARYAYRWIPEGVSQGNCSGLSLTPSGGETMGWHGEPWQYSATFADGHVDMISMRGCMMPPPDLGDSYPYLSGGPGSYNQYCMVTIRGKGWQIDTLPLPPVPSIFAH